ncbi:MAG: hypothetical protein M8872_09830 [marine benthic group bacterium]|nr:hypothetical protein [Gemmatimonadota bacterium]
MMGETGRDNWRKRASLLVLVLAATAAWACGGGDTPAEPTAVVEPAESQLSSGGAEQIVSEILEGTSASEGQRKAIEDLLASPEVRSDKPGAAWYLAAGLEKILTAEQVESLEAELKARRSARGERRRARSGVERAGESGEREHLAEQRRERTSAMQDRRELAQAAMRDALDLSEEQVAALDALRADRPARGEARENREERRESVAAILTEAQLRTVTLHRVLVAGWLRGHRGGGEGAHRHRRSRPESTQ